MPPMLCGLNEPLFPTVEYAEPDPCAELNEIAMGIAEEKWELYQDNFKDNFDVAYFEKCMQARSLESFTVTYNTAEYHYTLYYYDQAGNLVKTVPPTGVDAKHADATFLQDVKDYRAAVKNGIEESNLNREVPDHTLATHYRYNTLNQVIAQKTPDAGVSYFWYDRLGRLVISQNAQQFEDNKFSYTLYDALGRITEVGQKPQTYSMNQLISRDPVELEEWLTSDGVAQDVRNKEQITQTVYDYANEDIDLYLVQKNLRGRVSYTQVFNEEPDPLPTHPQHNSATYYSYDIHGNVKELLQDYGNPAAFPNVMNTTNNRFKKLVYNYDLVSGKVNEVHYQPEEADAFYHRYQYDNENRLTTVETSRDYVIWEKDARYTYYRHGPLARVILGHQQVQGVDYAYTLQGWLKGVNSTAVGDGTYDMGFDGKTGSTHSNIARDVFGFNLNYFIGDYASVNVNPFAAIGPLTETGTSLFNGNISSMVINLPNLGGAKIYGFGYDQLNRLVAMDAYEGLNNSSNTFTSVTINGAYKERLTYDANGNIKTYLRNSETGAAKNNYIYSYTASTNRLQGITNNVNTQSRTYSYDAIGNTTEDGMQGVTDVEWNVYGKVTKLINSNDENVTYTYSSDGQRISKKVGDVVEWYVRDASGNVMATYVSNSLINNGNLTLTESYKYGSTLLGINTQLINVESIDLAYVHIRGLDGYILMDHLGNTRATISDKKLQVEDPMNPGQILYYKADVKSAYYYSAYGAISNKYGSDPVVAFNGQRKSDEIGENAQTALFWEYNGDVGRRWNVDPIIKAWESPYAVFSNDPINLIDPLGLDAKDPKSNEPEYKTLPNVTVIAKRKVDTASRTPRYNFELPAPRVGLDGINIPRPNLHTFPKYHNRFRTSGVPAVNNPNTFNFRTVLETGQFVTEHGEVGLEIFGKGSTAKKIGTASTLLTGVSLVNNAAHSDWTGVLIDGSDIALSNFARTSPYYYSAKTLAWTFTGDYTMTKAYRNWEDEKRILINNFRYYSQRRDWAKVEKIQKKLKVIERGQKHIREQLLSNQ